MIIAIAVTAFAVVRHERHAVHRRVRVLLIIFMSALPVTREGRDINLPLETKTTQQPRSD